MTANELASRTDEELDDCMAWIDWRAEEEEVVGAVQAHTGEMLTCAWEDAAFVVRWNGEAYPIPLTESRCDRYVTMSSLAELLDGRYVFFLRNGFDGDDTHGMLVLHSACAAELRSDHAAWLDGHLTELERGIDHFSGLRIPYIRHESNNPTLRAELDAVEQGVDQFVKAWQSTPQAQRLMSELRVNIGTASGKEKAIYYARRLWWLLPLLAWLCLR